MPRRNTRPRSNAERGRAGRLRRADEIGKRDTAWLARYDRSVGQHRTARAAAPRLPTGPRARSNTERGRASTLRAKVRRGEPLSKRQARFLAGYDEAVSRGRQVRDVRRARKRKRSPLGDARAIARAIAEWLGGAGEVGRTEAGARTGGGSAEAQVSPPVSVLPGDPPELGGHLSGGHAMSVRVNLKTKTGSRWVTVLAYADRADVAALDLWLEILNAYDAYRATGILAVAVIVGPA